MRRFVLKSICAVLLTCVLAITLMGCSNDKKYLESLDALGIFNNTTQSMYAQTEVYKLVDQHMSATPAEGKTNKSIVIAFDGARADALSTISLKGDQDPNNLGINTMYSGINSLRKDGGLYLSYCGGVEGDKKTKQATSTEPGFATLLTGKWGVETGVIDNGIVMNASTDTMLKKYAKLGKKTAFTATWDFHFTELLKNEVDNPQTNQIFNNSTNEIDTHNFNKTAINDGTDVIFTIYETPDNVGHTSGYGNQNSAYTKAVRDSDNFAYDLIQTIEARENEDWLIIITTDHGGVKNGHGAQSMYERITWLATNKKLH